MYQRELLKGNCRPKDCGFCHHEIDSEKARCKKPVSHADMAEVGGSFYKSPQRRSQGGVKQLRCGGNDEATMDRAQWKEELRQLEELEETRQPEEYRMVEEVQNLMRRRKDTKRRRWQ